jgi:hypothetical protein
MDKDIRKALIAFRLLNKRGPINPLIREFNHKWGGRCVILTDTETGSWAMYNLAWSSIGRMQHWLKESGKPYMEPLIEEKKSDGSEKIS